MSINNYVFDADEIKLFKIDATEFLPQVTFMFTLTKTDASGWSYYCGSLDSNGFRFGEGKSLMTDLFGPVFR